MRSHRIESVEAMDFPVLRVRFDDGVGGSLDLSDLIGSSSALTDLHDQARFRAVTVADDGRRFGWRLGEPGHEIDFCADEARIRVETELVERLADEFRAARAAAE